jgi:hypothetical protein
MLYTVCESFLSFSSADNCFQACGLGTGQGLDGFIFISLKNCPFLLLPAPPGAAKQSRVTSPASLNLRRVRWIHSFLRRRLEPPFIYSAGRDWPRSDDINLAIVLLMP